MLKFKLWKIKTPKLEVYEGEISCPFCGSKKYTSEFDVGLCVHYIKCANCKELLLLK